MDEKIKFYNNVTGVNPEMGDVYHDTAPTVL